MHRMVLILQGAKHQREAQGSIPSINTEGAVEPRSFALLL